jgi:hypothetical protein
MPLIKIEHEPNQKISVIAAEEIAHLAVVDVSPVGSNYVALGSDTNPQRVAGVAWGSQSGSVSGKMMRVVGGGWVSGLVCGVAVNAGDRLQAASGGRVQPATRMGLTSGIQTASGIVSGSVTVTIPVIGRAFSSGAIGGGIQALFNIGG